MFTTIFPAPDFLKVPFIIAPLKEMNYKSYLYIYVILHVTYKILLLIQINNEQVASDNGNSACDKAQGHGLQGFLQDFWGQSEWHELKLLNDVQTFRLIDQILKMKQSWK